MPDPAPEVPVDRRARHKARTRRSIVDAAAALMDATRGLDFTVDELADRADVSRRTVFNHFRSVDDVVAAVLVDALHDVVDALGTAEPPPGEDLEAAMVADVARALRATDLVPALSSLTRGLGLDWGECEAADGRTLPAHGVALLVRSLSETGEDLAGALHRRHPGADRFDVDLTVGAMMSNLVVLHRYWFLETAGGADARSRAVWSALLERMLARAGAPAPTTASPRTPGSTPSPGSN